MTKSSVVAYALKGIIKEKGYEDCVDVHSAGFSEVFIGFTPGTDKKVELEVLYSAKAIIEAVETPNDFILIKKVDIKDITKDQTLWK